jgi:hypothetical protein
MKAKVCKKMSVLFVLLAMVLSMTLVGCAANTPSTSDSNSNSGTTSTGTGTTSGSGTTSTATTNTSTATTITDKTWLGDWTSSSEIVPPETPTQQYTLTTNADGTFTIADSGKELYKGTFTDTNAEKGTGWGTATISGTTINLQLVNAQGAYKLIFNAGDDYDKSIKKIVFI